MQKNVPSAFGCAVKTALMEQGLTQEWLAGQIRSVTGLYVDGAYLSHILAGKRNPPKIIAAIKEILKLDSCSDEPEMGA